MVKTCVLYTSHKIHLILKFIETDETSVNLFHSGGIGISLTCSFATVVELFCDEVLDAFVILSAISLLIKSPVAFAVF